MAGAAIRLLILGVLWVPADVFAASGPQYVAKFKLGVLSGSSLSITGKGIDLFSLWNLSATDTGRRGTVIASEELGVFTSNGNVRVVFFSNGIRNQITTNGNGFIIVYSTKVDKKGTAKAQSDKSIARPRTGIQHVFIGVSFTAYNNGNSSRSKFKFLIVDDPVDAATLLLPRAGRKNLPTLAGTTGFTVQIGSAMFVATPDSKGNVKFGQ
jgi:hypothetical protein